jgi:SAM-dependent methyltransferase
MQGMDIPPAQTLTPPEPPKADFQSWLDSAAGSLMRRQGAARVRAVLPNLFGYHAIQLGSYGDEDLLAASRISHRCRVLWTPLPTASAGCGLIGDPAALPFAADSVDVIMLPHVLEFCADPHQVLREAERVLIGEGYLLIIGFNPWSWCGLWQLLFGWRGATPWAGRFYSLTRLKDWLQLLGFEVIGREYFFHRPPVRSPALLRRLSFLERLGAVLWQRAGGAYFLVAKKRVECLIPLRTQWRLRRRVIAAGVVEPSLRRVMNGDR